MSADVGTPSGRAGFGNPVTWHTMESICPASQT